MTDLSKFLQSAFWKKIQKGLPLLGSLLSAILLASAFPGSGGNESIIFLALVPLMFSVYSASAKKAALLGLLSGFLFFLITLSWLHNLTHMVPGIGLKASALLGYALLALYCALYFIPFTLMVSACSRRWGIATLRGNLRTMFAVTSVWVASEYLRSILFTGFAWNPLGVSQYQSLAIVQIADLGGIYLISACIVWMNTALFITLRQYAQGIRNRKYRPHLELMLGLLPLALSVAYGFNILVNRPPLLGESVRATLIQPNIPQSEKWDAQKDQQIRERLESLTQTAALLGPTDLIIWPETALPDFPRSSHSSQQLLRRVVDLGSPLLVGCMDFSFSEEGKRSYYNSSILFGTNGMQIAKYDKQHLVPFGEYVPFPKLMGSFTPVDVNFTPGTESSLLAVPQKPPFSVLICFEDTVAPLALKAVRNGARWLVNQSNDAWFDPSSQSEQHLAHAVFRCIENRVPMARCCNSGISCTINPYGEVVRPIQPRAAGFGLVEIRPRPIGLPSTFYTQNGDAFAKFSLIAAATAIFVLRVQGRRKKSTK
jgi:apolipoprotein N-acyltransferase